jgi:hypothetical protein
MKTKEEIEKEFNEKFREKNEPSIQHYHKELGVPTYKVKISTRYLATHPDVITFIHQLRQDDIDNLIEWVKKKEKEHDKFSEIPNPYDNEDLSERIGVVNGYNQALTDILTHLKSIK